MSWQTYKVSGEATHHILQDGTPAYAERFDEVLKFHAPGLAPVLHKAAAWHIHPDGSPAYAARFKRTFGYYEGVAAVVAQDGWHHIDTSGAPLYAQRYQWCGNYQGRRCTVRGHDDAYHHLDPSGQPAYAQRWRYAGDFRDGMAVVQREDGRSTHIDEQGQLVHGRWFVDLDVFHKNFARACDEQGWMHIDGRGQPAYARRFQSVEPFYNGQARVELFNGSLEIIDERGRVMCVLRSATRAETYHSPADDLARTGYVLAPRILDAATQQSLRRAIYEILEHDSSRDLLRAADGKVRKILYPLEKNKAFLLALAQPKLMQLALELAPDPEQLVLTWEDVLIKPPKTGLSVPIHQDIALQSVQGGVFSLGVHLDDAVENPLRFIAGSHVHGPLTRAQLYAHAHSGTWSVIEPLAGDVLAHDVLVIHASDPNIGAQSRWTWYLEYRMLRDAHAGPWPMVWWLDRRALLFHAAAARIDAGLEALWPPCAPGETREQWLSRKCDLRIAHESYGVKYDLCSPYYHFGEE